MSRSSLCLLQLYGNKKLLWERSRGVSANMSDERRIICVTGHITFSEGRTRWIYVLCCTWSRGLMWLAAHDQIWVFRCCWRAGRYRRQYMELKLQAQKDNRYSDQHWMCMWMGLVSTCSVLSTISASISVHWISITWIVWSNIFWSWRGLVCERWTWKAKFALTKWDLCSSCLMWLI